MMDFNKSTDTAKRQSAQHILTECVGQANVELTRRKMKLMEGWAHFEIGKSNGDLNAFAMKKPMQTLASK